MAAELITPVDEETGLPYLIAPQTGWLPIDDPEIADSHHPWHPSNHPVFKTVAGMALRNSLLERTERRSHNEGFSAYHRFYIGPTDHISTDSNVIFERCVVACTGVIPNGVIDFSSGEPVERAITTQERWFFRTPSQTDQFGYRYLNYNYEPIRDFFREHTFKQDLSHLRNRLIDEFLFTKKEEDKFNIGRLLIANATAVAGDRVREKYTYLHRNGMMHPGMPKEVQTLINYKLGNSASRHLLVNELERKLLQTAS